MGILCVQEKKREEAASGGLERKDREELCRLLVSFGEKRAIDLERKKRGCREIKKEERE